MLTIQRETFGWFTTAPPSAAQRCCAAYARHGRQDSARLKRFAGVVFSPSIEDTLRRESNVGSWECVHLADSAKGDVLCGPFANPANRSQTRNRLLDIAERTKQIWISQRRFGHCLQCGRAGRRHSQSNGGNRGQPLRCRKYIRQICDESGRSSEQRGHGEQQVGQPVAVQRLR